MNVEEEIRNFIIENFIFDSNASELRNDASFLDEGIIDSTGILELVSFIEETYGFNIEDEELIPENLDSVDNVVSFIKRKRGETAQEAVVLTN